MDIAVTVIAGVLLIVGVLGTIFPILPGSILTIVTLLAWAWILGSSASWTAGIIGIVLAVIGMSASLILTGRTMRREKIPSRPITIGVLVGVVGMFVIPVVGLFLGFAVGLFAAELARNRDLQSAAHSSGQALKSMGLGMLLEFLCAALAASAFAIGTAAHFLG